MLKLFFALFLFSPNPNLALYHELDLADQVSYEAFEAAMESYDRVASTASNGAHATNGADGSGAACRRKDILTLIDFTKPSTEPRLWVIDMAARRVLITSHVAHGRGSGDNFATSFSNESGSHKSSLGVYLTENTYNGGNGYSLVLNGLEPGVNDNAKSRAVVVHGADYADPALAAVQGRLGRSLGCPALPRAVTREVIDTIKDGSVLYIYGRTS